MFACVMLLCKITTDNAVGFLTDGGRKGEQRVQRVDDAAGVV